MIPIISIRGVSKRYQLGKIGATRLKDEVSRWWSHLRSGGASVATPAGRGEFWALRNVSFDVGEGEVVGIIGANGAGKSTLLKILSEITEPTEGEIRLRGRVASLLEVGTGFHPDLSGRENVFLNAALLGMRKAEIRGKFDEIVAFAEVENFIDTPVKRYSSGMYMRLAFAVAAHLEPEILIVDEVLAVGDQSFQQKCLGKINDVAHGEGRTVLFVSHNMAAVNRLCDRVVHLAAGRVRAAGPAAEIVESYLSENARVRSSWSRPESEGRQSKVELTRVWVQSGTNLESAICPYTSPLTIEIECTEHATHVPWLLHVSIYDSQGNHLLSSCDLDEGRSRHPCPGRRLRASCTFPGSLLPPGRFTVTISATEVSGENIVALYEEWPGVVSFEVSAQGFPIRWRGANVNPPTHWTFAHV